MKKQEKKFVNEVKKFESFQMQYAGLSGIKTIKEKVIEAKEILLAMQTPKELREWAISNGMDNRSAFPKFKDALNEIGIDYNNIKREIKQNAADELEKQITHEVILYTDAKASKDRFAICDENGDVLWYGKFFDNDTDYNGEQSSGELASAKKAVWLASKIKEAVNAPAIRLILYVDAQWLTYQDKFKQKGSILSFMANKYNIQLDVEWIPGKDNPADEWTISSGFKKWSDNDLKKLAKPITESKKEKIETQEFIEPQKTNNMITKENYYSEIERIGITNLTKPMQEMHELMEKLIAKYGKDIANFTDADILKYKFNKQFEALEKLLNKNSPKEKEAEPKKQKAENKPKPKFKKGSYVKYLNEVYKIKSMKFITDNQLSENDGWHYDIGTGIMIYEGNLDLTEKPKTKSEKEITNSITNFVELVTPEIKFIKRFVALHGKTKTQEQILSFLNSLQKAIFTKIIRKTSPYKKEIEYIQDNLILVYNKMGSKIKIEIEPERLQTLNDFAISEKQMLSITYIKQYISLHGKTNIKEKAESLLKRINKAVESGKIPDNCPYMNEIKDIQIHLNEVINDKANRLTVEAATLNSLNGICNCKNNLSGRMPNNNKKGYKFYVVFDKKYIFGANEYKNDALDLMNDILENYPEIEHKIAVYTKSFLNNVLKINPNNNDNWRNYNTLHGLGFFSDMLANIAANFIYDIPAIKERFSNFTNKITTPNNSATPQTQPKSVQGLGKVNSMELKNMNFKNMGLKGKYAQLMGDPVEPCSIMIYGEPGSGKSTIVIDIAKTFATDYNKKIAFVAKEEGIGSTIQEKFKRLNAFHPNIDIYENHLPERINNYDFIIIDSVNEMGISYDELCKLNEQGKQNGVSFIYLFKSTKNGSFRGSQEFEHLVQVSLKVAGGIASTQKSRFGGHGSVRIFNNETQNIAKFPDYQKAEAYRNKISPNDFLTKGDDNKYWVISPEYASLLKQQGFQIL